MRAGPAALAGLLALAAGCTEPPAPRPRYVVGAPYAMGGLWSYPREEAALTETGLAAVLPRVAATPLTANGERHDPEALVAAHRTLQLPAIVAVTNLETGLSLRVRVHDRGPGQAGRVIGLSPRAAALLGVPEGGAAQVRLVLDGAASRALAAGLPSDEPRGPAIAAAPRGEVRAESLAPPPGARAAAGEVRVAAGGDPAGPGPAAVAPPERLPEQVERGPATPGRLVLDAGSFHRAEPARRLAARLGGLGARVQQEGRGREATWRVVMGPFASVAAADAAVAAAIAAGLAEVRLAVE